MPGSYMCSFAIVISSMAKSMVCLCGITALIRSIQWSLGCGSWKNPKTQIQKKDLRIAIVALVQKLLWYRP